MMKYAVKRWATADGTQTQVIFPIDSIMEICGIPESKRKETVLSVIDTGNREYYSYDDDHLIEQSKCDDCSDIWGDGYLDFNIDGIKWLVDSDVIPNVPESILKRAKTAIDHYKEVNFYRNIWLRAEGDAS